MSFAIFDVWEGQPIIIAERAKSDVGCELAEKKNDLANTADTGGSWCPWVRLFVGIVLMHLQ